MKTMTVTSTTKEVEAEEEAEGGVEEGRRVVVERQGTQCVCPFT